MVFFFVDLFVLGTRTLRKGGVMIRWLDRLGRCVGASDHARFCLPYGVCFGCILGHFIVPLQLHFRLHDYNEIVTSCNHSFSSPVRLSCVHRSCGEPRPTSAHLQFLWFLRLMMASVRHNTCYLSRGG